MSLDLTPGAAPIFLTKNYFSADANLYGGTFSVTDNAGLGPRVYDMDPFSYYVGVDATDGNTNTVMSQLYEGYSIATRSVDLVVLLNINIKNFVISYSADSGSTWTVLRTVTGNSSSTYVLDLTGSTISMNAFKVDSTYTFPANQAKQIGTIILCGYIYQPSRPPSTLKRKYFDDQRIVQLADNSEDITYIKRSPASHEFYGCDMSWTLLPDADRDSIRTVRRVNPNFCLYPEPGDRVGDLFYMRFDGNWEDGPSTSYKGNGNDLKLAFKEISS